MNISFRTEIRKSFLSYLQYCYSTHFEGYEWDSDVDKTKILIADRRPEKMVYPAIISVPGRFTQINSIGSMHGDARLDGTRNVNMAYEGNIYLKVFASNEIESDTIACDIANIFGNIANVTSFVKNSDFISQLSGIIINPTIELKTDPKEFVTIVWIKLLSHFTRIYKLVDSSKMGSINVNTDT